MDVYFHLFSLILLWIGGCRCIPKQYQVSNISSPHTSYNKSRSSDGWSEKDMVHTAGGTASRVVFPSHDEDRRKGGPRPYPTRLTLRIQSTTPPPPPDHCRGSAKFCKDTTDYPQHYLDSLLRKAGDEFQALFGSDYVEPEDRTEDNITTRINEVEGTPLCQPIQNLEYPTKGEDKDGTIRYIINHGNFTQGVRTEKCMNEESSCGDFGDQVPLGYETYCKQKYIYRKLLALDDAGSLQMMQFPLPSCCMCLVVSRVDSLRSRFGFSPRMSKYKVSQKFS